MRRRVHQPTYVTKSKWNDMSEQYYAIRTHTYLEFDIGELQEEKTIVGCLQDIREAQGARLRDWEKYGYGFGFRVEALGHVMNVMMPLAA